MGACGSTPKVLKDDAPLAPEIENEPEQGHVAEKDFIIEAKQAKNEPANSLEDNVEVVDQLDNTVDGDHERSKGNNKNEENRDEKNAAANDINIIPSEPIANENEEEQPHPELIKEAEESKHENASADDQGKTSQSPAVEQKTTTSDDNAKVADVPKIEESNIAETSAPKKNGFPDIGNKFRSLVSNITKGLNNNDK